MRRLILIAFLSACTPLATQGPTALPTSGSPSPATVSPSALPAASTSPGPNEQCTADPVLIGRTEFVIERYYQLSDGGSVAAISDCFARINRESNRNFTEGAQVWSTMGPAFGVVIRRLDLVNGCERFSASATMRGSTQQTTSYFVIGPESGRTRIYAIQSALAAPELETTRCQ